VRLHPGAEELAQLDVQARLLANLSPQSFVRSLSLFEEAARKPPAAGPGVERPAAEQDPAVALDHGMHAGDGVRPGDVAAAGTDEPRATALALDPASRTEAPPAEDPHGATVLAVPRHVPATVHELTRVGMLSGLPGEHLSRLAARLEREEIPPGETVVREGDPGDRFYIVLSGMLNVSQEGLGERRILRPGDAFGEVALAMGIPRTASVRAVTPAVIASCDQAAFDELLRPLFADE
jgi:hypothetical protein